MLSGCVTAIGPEKAGVATDATTAVQESQPQDQPVSQAAPPITEPGQDQQLTALQPQQVPTVKPAPDLKPAPQPEAIPEPQPEPLLAVPLPDSLIGYPAYQIDQLFGTPSFIRRDPPGELWQYKSTACILDLYLYDGGAGNFTLRYLEFRQTRQQPENFEICLRAIISEEISGIR